MGITNHSITYKNQDADICELEVVGDDLAYTAWQFVTLTRNGRVLFAGRVKDRGLEQTGKRKSKFYTVQGPWWYLENLPYREEWKVRRDGEMVWEWKSKAVLGRDRDWNVQTNMEVVRSAVQQCITAGAPFEIGVIDAGIQFPKEAGEDMTCAEVIRRMLRWSPDACCWFDYSSGTPVFHCRKRFNAPAVEIDLAEPGERVIATMIGAVKRSEYAVPGVIIKYERSTSSESKVYRTLETDKYPSDISETTFGVLFFTVNLDGPSASYQNTSIKTEAIEESSSAWWKKKLPWLNDVQNLVIEDSQRAGELPNELVEGALAEWMNKESEEDEISCRASWTYKDPGTNSEVSQKSKILKVKVTATDAETNNFSRCISASSADPVPTGIAQQLYEALNSVHYDGRVRLVGQDLFATPIFPGYRLNLINGDDEAWETMNAVVQEVYHDVKSGATEITFGPPKHLQLDDLIELQRLFRTRRHSSVASKSSGEVADEGQTVELGGAEPMKSESAGGGAYDKLGLVKGDKRISLDPDDLGGTLPTAMMRLRKAANDSSGAEVDLYALETENASQVDLLVIVGKESGVYKTKKVTIKAGRVAAVVDDEDVEDEGSGECSGENTVTVATGKLQVSSGEVQSEVITITYDNCGAITNISSPEWISSGWLADECDT
jgi:hypothetical protein